jgi:hypothetical protein
MLYAENHWVMSWGQEAELSEPYFLREEIVKELNASSRRYDLEREKAEPV